MTWQTEIVTIVRWLIDDREATPENSDADLQEAIAVAAQLTQKKVNFPTTYLVDVTVPSISPDPTDDPKDDAFINLVSLKAACIVCNGEAKEAARCSMNVQDGLSRIDTRDKAKWLWSVASAACGHYEDEVFKYQMGQLSVGEAIIGPFSNGHPRFSHGFPELGPRHRNFH